MNKQAAQIRDDEKVQRKRLELALEEAVWKLINDIEDEEVYVPLRAKRIWRWLYIPPLAALGLWYSLKVVIDLQLLRTKPDMRLTMDGLRVNPPNSYMPYWVRDSSLRDYSNDELREMTQSICSVYEDQH